MTQVASNRRPTRTATPPPEELQAYAAARAAGLLPTTGQILDDSLYAEAKSEIQSSSENEHMAAAMLQALAWQRNHAQHAMAEAQVSGLHRKEIRHLSPVELRLSLRNRAWSAGIKMGRRPRSAISVSKATPARQRERRDGSSRNQTRGGPEEADGEPDPDPRICAYGPCGAHLAGLRADAKFCSPRCRLAAHRGCDRPVEVVGPTDPYRADMRDGRGLTEDGRQFLVEVLVGRVARCLCEGGPLRDSRHGDCVLCGRPATLGDRQRQRAREFGSGPLAARTAYKPQSRPRSPWRGEKWSWPQSHPANREAVAA